MPFLHCDMHCVVCVCVRERERDRERERERQTERACHRLRDGEWHISSDTHICCLLFSSSLLLMLYWQPTTCFNCSLLLYYYFNDMTWFNILHYHFVFSRSQINYIIISGKQNFVMLRKLSCYLGKTNRKLTCYHGKTEEIKCMNAWAFRASIYIFRLPCHRL